MDNPVTAGRLGDYLRARRERLRPEDVGLASGDGRRRVPGLRRDEVAVLAGISTNYYLRLEQGRDRRPSDQVLRALARALNLDPVASRYLHGLATPPAPPSVAGGAATSAATSAASAENGDVVAESLRWLIDSWPRTAAVIHNRYTDVLASNALAQALNPNFRPGVNSTLSLFVDPSEQSFHHDWEALASRSVAQLRKEADRQGGDRRLEALVAEGSRRSALFRRFWQSGDVVSTGAGVHGLHHPVVGDIMLQFLRVPVANTDGQAIFLYHAEPGSAGEVALARLAAAEGDHQGHDAPPLRV